MPNHIRAGFHTLTPYLIVENAAELIEFVQTVFDAVEVDRSQEPDGRLTNVMLRIGDSMLEISEARPEWPCRPGSIHLYVESTDAAYGRAIAAGGRSIYEPTDMPYGERSGGVEDAHGNHWYIATYTG